MKTSSSGIRVALMAMILLGAISRVAGLGAQSLWLDEAHSAQVALRGWPSLMSTARTYFGGLFYYAQLHLWASWLGASEFALRLPSALASLLIIPLLYQLGRRIASPRAALVAALLVTCSPLDLWYAQEARMYALAAFLGVLCAYGYVRYRQTSAWGFALCYVLSGLAGLYTLYSFAFLLVALGAHWALTLAGSAREAKPRSSTPAWLTWIAAHGLLLAGFAPWWPVLWGHLRLVAEDMGRWQALASLVRISGPIGLSGSLLVLLIGVGAALLALLSGRGRRWLARAAQRVLRPGVVLWWSSSAYLALALVAGWHPISSVRQVTILTPFACLAVALALDRWRRRRAAVLALLLLVAVASAGYARATVQKEQWREVAQRMAAQERPGDAVLLHAFYTEPAFSFYYAGHMKVWRFARPEDETRLMQVAQAHERVWLVLSHDAFEDPQRLVERWWDARATLAQEVTLTGIRVRLYETR
ncbi:MAG: hypothetical protein GXY76_00235 [Chloroflexi bacterium]|nr:hypothetical protein [Chloroflexota bacterium]